VTANPGCIIQIAQGLAAKGSPIQVLHLVELLDQAYSPSPPKGERAG
jgi:Fe-S oxidoreductase